MAAKPVTLKVRDVALAAKKAYDEGRLSAQGPTPACQYRDPSGRPCAIGAALHTQTAKRFDRGVDASGGTTISALVDAGAIKTDDARALTRLQKAHDLWCEGPNTAEDFVAILTEILTQAEVS